MTCQEIQGVIDAFVDRESDSACDLGVEEHLQTCSLCNIARQNREMLRSVIKAHLGGPRCIGADSLCYEAPIDLKRKMRSALLGASKPESPRPLWMRWGVALVSSAGLIAVFVICFTIFYQAGSAKERIGQEVISSHVRCLMGNHPVELLSSDERIVKTWFNGKLDFAPDVESLTGRGFPLYGCRVDYVGNKAVAALVYRRAEHFINVFAWPTDEGAVSPDFTMTRQGFNLVAWTKADMDCWAVSDLDIAELKEFAGNFQGQYSSRSPD